MKFIAAIIWIALLAWTWNVATAQRPISIKTYREIEAELGAKVPLWLSDAHISLIDVSYELNHAHIVVPDQNVRAEIKIAGRNKTSGDVVEVRGHFNLESQDKGKTWVITDHHLGGDAH